MTQKRKQQANASQVCSFHFFHLYPWNDGGVCSARPLSGRCADFIKTTVVEYGRIRARILVDRDYCCLQCEINNKIMLMFVGLAPRALPAHICTAVHVTYICCKGVAKTAARKSLPACGSSDFSDFRRARTSSTILGILFIHHRISRFPRCDTVSVLLSFIQARSDGARYRPEELSCAATEK